MNCAKRLFSVLFAAAVCFTASIPGNTHVEAESASRAGNTMVRVGMYVRTPVLDTRRFSSRNRCESGFEIGYSDGSNFYKLFDITATNIIILPQVNADADYSSENGNCKKGVGNVGAYSLKHSAYGTYSGAMAEASRLDGGFVAVTKNGYESRSNSASSFEELAGRFGKTNVSSPVTGGFTVLDGDAQKILFTFEDTSRKFAVRGKGGATVTFPMKHYSGSINRYSYPGFFEYSVDSEQLFMVNVLDLETYTKCVMSNEIGTNFKKETRRAFSVLARTFPFRHKHASLGFDVCNCSGCCQVYYGVYRMSEENNEIVDSTRGQICSYNGTPISVLYHSANGGASCSSVAAWGGKEVPYLTTVFLENDEIEESAKWERVFTRTGFYDYLRSRPMFSSLSDDEISMRILDTDPYGSDYITVLSVSDGSGNEVTVENSEKIRSTVGFSSANFKIEYSADIDVLTSNGTVETKRVTGILTEDGYHKFSGFDESYTTLEGTKISPDKVTINGVGAGHGVGFSAAGSEKLARDGYNYKYILGFFFSGTSIVQL